MMTQKFYPRQAWRLATAALLLAAATVACTKDSIDEDMLAEVADVQQEGSDRSRTFDISSGQPDGSTLRFDTIETFDPETFESTTEIVVTVVGPGGEEIETFKSGPFTEEELEQRGEQNAADASFTAKQMVRGQEVLRIVDQMPYFRGAGCADGERACNERAMLQHLYSQIKYPEAVRDAGVEGKVLVQFVVGTDGAILEPEIIRSPHEALSEEVLRIMGEMPEWAPGRNDGKPVQVSFVLPVQFMLD